MKIEILQVRYLILVLDYLLLSYTLIIVSNRLEECGRNLGQKLATEPWVWKVRRRKIRKGIGGNVELAESE